MLAADRYNMKTKLPAAKAPCRSSARTRRRPSIFRRTPWRKRGINYLGQAGYAYKALANSIRERHATEKSLISIRLGLEEDR